MGISGSKQKAETKPVYAGAITGAQNTLAGVYNQQAPKIQGYADQFGALVPSLVDRFTQGNAAVNAAQGYVTDTLAGDPAQNPYLDDMIAMSNDSVRNQTQASLGTRGLTGGSAYADLISRNLANNETGLRYTDYNNAQARRAQAAGMAPGLVGAEYAPLAAAESAAGVASGLPLQAAGQFAAGTGGLLGQYGVTTQTSKPGLAGYLGMGLQAASLFSDRRTKQDIRRIGQTDAGLPLYQFRYIGEEAFHIGPMADEVERMQPDALGPMVGGFQTVYYGDLR